MNFLSIFSIFSKKGGGGGGFNPTPTQLDAINSGATSEKIRQITTNKETIDALLDEKQDKITDTIESNDPTDTDYLSDTNATNKANKRWKFEKIFSWIKTKLKIGNSLSYNDLSTKSLLGLCEYFNLDNNTKVNFYITNFSDKPDGDYSGYAGYVEIFKRNENYYRLSFTPYSQNHTYINNYNNGTWTGWVDLATKLTANRALVSDANGKITVSDMSDIQLNKLIATIITDYTINNDLVSSYSTHIYRMGNMVFCNINVYLKSSNEGILISGLPTSNDKVWGVLVKPNSNVSGSTAYTAKEINMNYNTGDLYVNGNNVTGWVKGFLCYITKDD